MSKKKFKNLAIQQAQQLENESNAANSQFVPMRPGGQSASSYYQINNN